MDVDISGNTFKWSEKHREPKYCEYCGEVLSVIDNRSKRFDKFTGVIRLTGSVLFRCVNWGKAGEGTHTSETHDPDKWNDTNIVYCEIKP